MRSAGVLNDDVDREDYAKGVGGPGSGGETVRVWHE
jgi:hypothetical protein